MKKQTLFQLCCIGLLSMTLWACHKPNANLLIIGTIAGPETDLVEVAKDVAEEKYGLEVKIVMFNDYNLPNEALQEGSLDANIYQHLPYLQETIAAQGYDLEVIGKTFVYPMGVYSSKYKSLSQIPKKAIIAIPNDPSNESRALILLQHAGLIQLKKGPNPSVKDIISNKKQWQFKPLDAAQLPRVMPDVDASVINTTYALPAGLNPSRDAIYLENKHSPYANLIVVHKNSDKLPQLQEFVKAMHSDEVKKKAQDLFGDAAIAAW